MKKTIALLSLLIILAITSTQSANATFIHNKGYISVNTSSETEISPDTAQLSVVIKTSDEKSMQTASEENKKISEKVFKELNSLINTEKGDYVKTSYYNASPIYSYINSKRVFDKYEVTNTITVYTKNIEKLGNMIDNSITLGASNIENLQFSTSNYESKCNDLIKNASIKAQERASEIANSLSTKISGVRSIETSCNANQYNTPRMYYAKNMISDVASSVRVEGNSTAIATGTIKIYANVNASFFVK